MGGTVEKLTHNSGFLARIDVHLLEELADYLVCSLLAYHISKHTAPSALCQGLVLVCMPFGGRVSQSQD